MNALRPAFNNFDQNIKHQAEGDAISNAISKWHNDNKKYREYNGTNRSTIIDLKQTGKIHLKCRR